MIKASFAEVDLSNPVEFEENLHLLDPRQQSNYKDGFSVYKTYGTNERCFNEIYYNNARFLVHADSTQAQRICRCGVKSGRNTSGACGIRRFCSRCAYSKFLSVYHKFKNSFGKGTFYFVTLSYEEGLPFSKKFASQHYWEAPCFALQALVNNGMIEGAVVSGEYSVESFIPLVLNPHCHAIVHADGWTEDCVDELKVQMAHYLCNEIEGDIRIPKIHVLELQDREHFRSKLRYALKPMDLLQPYQSALSTIGDTHETRRALNENVKEFVRSTVELSKDGRDDAKDNIRLLRYFGTMHPLSKSYIGSKHQRTPSKRLKRRVVVPCPVVPIALQNEERPRVQENTTRTQKRFLNQPL